MPNLKIKTKTRWITAPLLFAVWVYCGAKVAMAAGLVPCGGPNEPECNKDQLDVLITNIFDYLVTISVSLAVIVIIYGGIILLTSGGSEARISQGKKAILSAVVGLAIVLGSSIIITTVIKALSD